MTNKELIEQNYVLANVLMTARALIAAEDSLRNLENMRINTPESDLAHKSIKEHLQDCLTVLKGKYDISEDLIYYEI